MVYQTYLVQFISCLWTEILTAPNDIVLVIVVTCEWIDLGLSSNRNFAYFEEHGNVKNDIFFIQENNCHLDLRILALGTY